MLEKEANYKAQLQEAKKAEKSKANQEYIQEITITYKKEWKIAVKKEKTKESANANKLLDELNDL